MSEMLKPCPFCGGIPTLEEKDSTHYYRYRVFCKNCDASQAWEHTERIAVSQWNTRHECKCDKDDIWTYVCGYREE